MNGKKEILEKLKKARYIHFIKRNKNDLQKPAINVELLNNLNCFYKPGYEFKSMSLEEDKIENFLNMLEKGEIEAYCIIE